MAPKRKSQQGGEGTRKSPRTSGVAQQPSTAASTYSSTAAAAAGDEPPDQDPAPRFRSSRRRGAPPPPPPAAAAAVAAPEGEEVSDWDKLTQKEARKEILQMLNEHDLDHLYYLDCRQLTNLAKILVQSNNPHRKKDIQQLIDNHRQAYKQQEESSSSSPEEAEGSVDDESSSDSADGESSHQPLHELHDVELNELSCTLDYLFKTKAAIIQAETLLMEGKATAMKRDDDWMPIPIDGKNTSYSGFRTDIYVWAPRKLKYEVCQGAAKRNFGDYKAFKHDPVTIESYRYLVGLFTARVFDTSPHQIYDNGVLLDAEEEMYERELQYTFKEKDSVYKIDIAIIGPKETMAYTLHRFVQIIAMMYGVSIFADGMLERLHLSLPDKKRYDDFVVYRPLDSTNEKRKILNDLRVGKAHSFQCDVDHRLGSTKARYLHGLLYAAPTSHCMNMCFTYTRKTAGHWCFGLFISKYSGGKKTTSVSHKFLKRIKIVNDKQTFDKAAIDGIDPFTVLPPLIKDWIIDVDCYCSSLKKGESLCDICKKNAEEKAKIENADGS